MFAIKINNGIAIKLNMFISPQVRKIVQGKIELPCAMKPNTTARKLRAKARGTPNDKNTKKETNSKRVKSSMLTILCPA